MCKSLFSLLILMVSVSATVAQDHRLSVTPEFNIPIGKMKWSYKASPGIQLNYSYIQHSNRRGIGKYFGVSLGYTSIAQLKDTLYFVVDKGAGNGGAGLGTAVYSPFQLLSIRLTSEFDFRLAKRVFLNLGFGLGGIYGKRTVDFATSFGGDDSSGEIATWVTGTGKVGLNFMATASLSINPYFGYTAMIEAGNTNENSLNYNPDTGSFYHFYSPGIAIAYGF